MANKLKYNPFHVTCFQHRKIFCFLAKIIIHIYIYFFFLYNCHLPQQKYQIRLTQSHYLLHSLLTAKLVKHWWRVEEGTKRYLEGWFHMISSLMMINVLWGVIQILSSWKGNEEHFLSLRFVIIHYYSFETHTHRESITQQSISQCC